MGGMASFDSNMQKRTLTEGILPRIEICETLQPKTLEPNNRFLKILLDERSKYDWNLQRVNGAIEEQAAKDRMTRKRVGPKVMQYMMQRNRQMGADAYALSDSAS